MMTRPRRLLKAPVMLAILIASGLAAVPVAVPGVEAQGGSDVSAPDAPGDVVILAPSADGVPTPLPVDAAAPNEVAGPVDLTEVRFWGESPTEFNLGYTVSDFSRANMQLFAGFEHFVCFQWAGTGDWYQFRAAFRFGQGGAPSGQITPEYETGYLDRLYGECNPFALIGDNDVIQHRFPPQLTTVSVDLDAGTVDVRIPRIAFETATADQTKGPVPKAGDAVQGIKAMAVMKQGKNYYFYDETSTTDTAFSSDTGNNEIRVSVAQNINSAVAGVRSQGGVPVYGVETGSFQTVPVTIENHLDEPIMANVSFIVVDGDAGKWDVRVIPSIPVGKARQVTVEGEPQTVPGSETVTLIVNSNTGVQHKERLRLLISATDGKFPGILGAALVDIVAVEPPTVEKKSLYFHSIGQPCNTNGRWLNTLQSDPAATSPELEFTTCAQGANDLDPTAGGGVLAFRPDVPFARDYIMSTAEATQAVVALKSVSRVPGAPDQETNVPLTANVHVQVLAGSALFGEGEAEATVDGGIVPVTVPLEFQGISPGATTRFVSADDPLAVRITVSPISRTLEICNDDEPCKSLGGQREQEVPASITGRIFLMTDQSKVDLPVRSSERTGPQINITASGALISLRLSDLGAEKRVFTNPGKIVVFNVTVRNEGVNVDTARLSAQVNQTGWQVEILPKRDFRLDVGEPRAFNVRITAPEGAAEGHTAGITLVARSDVDPEAEARLPLVVSLTRGTQFEDQEVDANLQVVDEEEAPIGVLLPTLVLAGLAFVVGRRRR